MGAGEEDVEWQRPLAESKENGSEGPDRRIAKQTRKRGNSAGWQIYTAPSLFVSS
jgi:hypothetical protein